MARVLVTRRLPGNALARLTEAGHEVTVWPERLPPAPVRLAELAAGAEGLLCTLEDAVDARLLAQLPGLRVVATYAVGHDNIDLAACRARGIAVGNTPDVLTDATADLTWALLLAVARGIVPAAAAARVDWSTWEPTGFLGAAVAGRSLAIVGPGRIGRAVARRAAGFDMAVTLLGRGDPGELRRALAGADFISLHCPLTAATRHLIDHETLAGLRPEAILVNTARGGLIDSQALADALSEGRLAGAALDVTDPEPLPGGDPLWDAPNLLITPHIGSATLAARSAMAELAVENLLDGLAGRPLPHPVVAP